MNGQGLFLLSVLLSCTHVPLARTPQPGNAFPSEDIPPFDVRSHFARVMTLHGQGLYTGWEACGILLHRPSPPRYPIYRSVLLYTCTWHPLFSYTYRRYIPKHRIYPDRYLHLLLLHPHRSSLKIFYRRFLRVPSIPLDICEK